MNDYDWFLLRLMLHEIASLLAILLVLIVVSRLWAWVLDRR